MIVNPLRIVAIMIGISLMLIGIAMVASATLTAPYSWEPHFSGYTTHKAVGGFENLTANDGKVMIVYGADVGLSYVTTVRPTADIQSEWKAGLAGISGCGAGAEYACVDDAITEAAPSSFDTTTHIDTTGLVADATEEFTMGDVSFPANSWVLNLKIGIVLKQNETTSFASTVLIEIMNTNGTTCYTNDIGVSPSVMTVFWYTLTSCRSTGWVSAWTQDIINQATMRISWLAPYFHTVSITAIAWSVNYHQTVTGIEYSMYLDPLLDKTLSYKCNDGSDSVDLAIVKVGAVNQLLDVEACDNAYHTIDVSIYDLQEPFEIIFYNALNYLGNSSASMDVVSMGTPSPQIPTSFEWFIVIGLLIVTIVVAAWYIGRWLYD